MISMSNSFTVSHLLFRVVNPIAAASRVPIRVENESEPRLWRRVGEGYQTMGTDLLVGIAAGVVASLIFFFFLACLRPRLHVSAQIARTPTGTADPTDLYRIKIVNRSRRVAVDFVVEAYLTTFSRTAGTAAGERGTVVLREPVAIGRTPHVIAGYRRSDDEDRHAIWIRLSQGAGAAVADGDHTLTISITAKDGWSGFPGARTTLYELASDVILGSFVPGSSMKIRPLDEAARSEAATPRTPLEPA